MTIGENALLQRISISLERIANYMQEELEMQKFHLEEYKKAQKEKEHYLKELKRQMQPPINKKGVN